MSTDSLSSDRSPLLGTLALATVAGGLAFGFLCSNSGLDDPYIYGRYAKNFLRTGEFVWNIGGPRVEGFSSPAWLVGYVFAEANGLPSVSFARALGLLSLTLLLASGARSFVQVRETRSVFVGLTALATSFDLGYYAASGMDNVLWALVVWQYLRWLSCSGTASRLQLLAGALAILIRPEGFLLLFVAAAVSAIREAAVTPANRSNRRSLVVHFIFWGAIPLALLFAMRRIYFGRWLPNAAAAKHYGGSIADRVLEGVLYSGEGVALYAAIPIAVAAVVMAEDPRDRREQSDIYRQRVLPYIAFILAAGGFAVIGGGDDIAAFGRERLWVPLIVPLTYVLVLLLAHAWERKRAWGPAVALVVAVVIIRVPHGLALFKSASGANSLSTGSDVATQWMRGFSKAPPSALSNYLREATPPGEFIAVPWAGRVPYETDLPTIDLLGLNDPHIGQMPLKDRGIDVRYDPDYVLDLAPLFICENFGVTESLEAISRKTDGELRAIGAIKRGQRDLLRNPKLRDKYRVDYDAPVSGTCLRRVTNPK